MSSCGTVDQMSVQPDTTASPLRNYSGRSQIACDTVGAGLSRRRGAVVRLNSTFQPPYLKATDMGSVPVATVGVVRAVSIPVVALIVYIDIVLLSLLAT